MPNIYHSGPSTALVDWGTTGEKTLLVITDNLSSGKKAVIFTVGWDAASDVPALGTLRIKKGANVLPDEGITRVFNAGGMRAKAVMIFAYDSAAAGNDSYSLVANVSTAATGTSTLHVQGMSILLDDVAFYNAAANNSITAGSTADLVSVSPTYPAGVKLIILAYVMAAVASTTANPRLFDAGNIRITDGSSILSSNQFQLGTEKNDEPALVPLIAVVDNMPPNPTYKIQIMNNLSETVQAWGQMLVFTVPELMFLDTGAVALANGSQTTVGDLTTYIAGDEIGVIGLLSAENTGAADATIAAGNVVLQRNNATADQKASQRGWYLYASSQSGRCGTLPLMRVDANIANPTYQMKATAPAAGLNGEAKIAVFTFQRLRWWVGGKITGKSTYMKPVLTAAEAGYVFIEDDTGKVYIWSGTAWASASAGKALIWRAALSISSGTMNHYHLTGGVASSVDSGSETQVYPFYLFFSGTIGNMAINVVSNASGNSITLTLRKNNNTNVFSITVPSGATGRFINTATASINEADFLKWRITQTVVNAGATVSPALLRWVE